MHQATIGKLQITYPDQLEFDTLHEEIFKKRSYYVDLDTNTPVIIDAGAHIGMTALYLLSLYPHADLTCIEPNPTNLALLHENLFQNGFHDVTIVPKALVGGKEDHVNLYVSDRFSVFSSLNRGGWTGLEETHPVSVETCHLSEFLARPIDLLKIDIEGEETAVITQAQAGLRFVKHVIIEFHKTASHHEDKLLKILEGHGFTNIDVTKDVRREKDQRNRLLIIEASRQGA